jgi:hypothetical protein
VGRSGLCCGSGAGYFYVEHGRVRALHLAHGGPPRSRRGLSHLLVWLASGRHAEEVTVLRQTIELFSFTNGSMSFHDELSWLPLAVSALTVALIVVGECSSSHRAPHRVPAGRPLPADGHAR